MYHNEKIINGVLCWRRNINAEYKPFTLEELTNKIHNLKLVIEDMRDE